MATLTEDEEFEVHDIPWILTYDEVEYCILDFGSAYTEAEGRYEWSTTERLENCRELIQQCHDTMAAIQMSSSEVFSSRNSLYQQRFAAEVLSGPQRHVLAVERINQRPNVVGEVQNFDTPVESKPDKTCCTQCNRSFKRLQELTRHLREVHFQTGPDFTFYVCDVCGKSFMRKFSLSRHSSTCQFN